MFGIGVDGCDGEGFGEGEGVDGGAGGGDGEGEGEGEGVGAGGVGRIIGSFLGRDSPPYAKLYDAVLPFK